MICIWSYFTVRYERFSLSVAGVDSEAPPREGFYYRRKVNVNWALKCRVVTQTGGQKVRQTVDMKSGVSVDYT